MGVKEDEKKGVWFASVEMYTFLSCYPRKAIRGCESVFGHHTWTKTPDNTDVHT